MKAIWEFALENPMLLAVTACGFVLTWIALRIKNRYINEGLLFKRQPAQKENHCALKEEEMSLDNHIDLEIALRKFYELGLEDGDLGYAYWHEVAQLLKQAAGMQSRIRELSKELEQCRARLSKTD
ncbi:MULTISPECIES: hypothetical protein [Paraburkholderia]|nr:hypothetical protein [Paraburkholderia ginsengisoli]